MEWDAMATMTTESPYGGVGQRVRNERIREGLSQEILAQRSNVSLSLIRKVEQGKKPATQAFVSSVAPVLKVSTASLLGMPFGPVTPEDQRVHAGIPDLRRELAAYKIPAEDIEIRSTVELAGEVARASRLRHGVKLEEMGGFLPGLLRDLRVAWTAAKGAERERIMALAAEAYAAAGQLTWKLGYTDLSSVCTDRYEWAAAQSDDPLLVLVGDYQRAGELISGADWNAALNLLEASRAGIEVDLSTERPEVLSVWGNLHLKSALAAARAGRRELADDHWQEATDTARRLGTDRDDYRLCFGPTNAYIWGVGLATEMMDGTTAIARARDLILPERTPRERVGHHHIDLGRAWLLHGNRAEALKALNAARRIAPSQTRYHPMVHETTGQMIRDEARATESLRAFAAWCGLTHV